MKHWILGLVVIAMAAVSTLDAKETSVTGTWTLNIDRIGVKLVLEQKGGAVTGTLDWPHGDPIKLTGALVGSQLTFFGNSAGENFAIHITSTGSVKADGSLAGTIHAHFDEFKGAREVFEVRDQEIPWTAVRGLHGVMHFRR